MAVKTENRTAERVTIRLSLSERRALDRVPGEARADQVRNAIAAYESVARIDEKIERLRAEQNRIAEQMGARIDATLARVEGRVPSNLCAEIEKISSTVEGMRLRFERIDEQHRKQKTADAAPKGGESAKREARELRIGRVRVW